MATKAAPKRRVLELVSELDEDVSYREILYRQYLLQQIDEGLEDVEQGRTISHEDLGEEIEEWSK